VIAQPAQAPTAPEPFTRFEVHPPLVERGKKGARLARTDILSVTVQSINQGGETNLHAHMDQDAAWLVLNGQAKFYTEGDSEVATLNRYEGLVIPRGTLYWFESSSDENLIILRMAAKHPDLQPGRENRGERVSREFTKIKEGEFFGL